MTAPLNLTAQTPKGSTRSASLDFLKLVLSVFVVAIHAELPLSIFTPVLRMAVPLFFCISGYFYFQKVHAAESPAVHRKIYKGFFKRTASLYAFWFVVLSPITFFIRDWFDEGFLPGLLRFLQSLLFNSTFRASWYLSALLLGMLLIHALSRVLRAKTLVFLTLPVYLLCCLFTNYYGLVQEIPFFSAFRQGYETIFISFPNGFAAALFWFALSNLLAETKKRPSRRTLTVSVLVGLLLLLTEGALLAAFSPQAENDCYLSLLLLCPAVFLLVFNTDFHPKTAQRWGAISTITYTTHASFLSVFFSLEKHLLPQNSPLYFPLAFAATLLFCYGISRLIFLLETRKGFSLLRLSH